MGIAAHHKYKVEPTSKRNAISSVPDAGFLTLKRVLELYPVGKARTGRYPAPVRHRASGQGMESIRDPSLSYVDVENGDRLPSLQQAPASSPSSRLPGSGLPSVSMKNCRPRHRRHAISSTGNLRLPLHRHPSLPTPSAPQQIIRYCIAPNARHPREIAYLLRGHIFRRCFVLRWSRRSRLSKSCDHLLCARCAHLTPTEQATMRRSKHRAPTFLARLPATMHGFIR